MLTSMGKYFYFGGETLERIRYERNSSKQRRKQNIDR